MRKATIIFLIIICLFFQISPVLAEMSSANYKIQADVIGFGSKETGVSANYILKETGGETISGSQESANYKVKAGYRYMAGEAPAAAASEQAAVSGGGGGGGPLPKETAAPAISEIKYTAPDPETIIIEWKTNEPATTELDFGMTPEYELGKLTAEPGNLVQNHKIIIRDLKSDTTYYFRPRVKDLRGNETIDKGFIYTTPDILAPANVSSLKAVPSDKKIVLQWKNPSDKDFEGVKIQRSAAFFPENKDEGENIYDGKGEIFIDNNLENGKRYYYTVFSYDKNGNFSSGAIVSEVPRAAGAVPTTTTPVIPPEIIPPTEVPNIPPELIPPIPKEKVEILDFSKVLSFTVAKGTIELKPDEENKIKILPNVALKISIAKEKLSPFLKSIIATIGESSYLLKINKKGDAYETSFITPGELGKYALNVLNLIYKEGKIRIAKGKIEVEEAGYVYKGNVILNQQAKNLVDEQRDPSLPSVAQDDKGYKVAQDDKIRRRIARAEITLYQFNSEKKQWEKWVGTQYFQANPEITDIKGEYAFIVAPGKYYITVSKKGYKFQKIAEFEAKNLINLKIELQPTLLSTVIKVIGGLVILTIIFILFKRNSGEARKLTEIDNEPKI